MVVVFGRISHETFLRVLVAVVKMCFLFLQNQFLASMNHVRALTALFTTLHISKQIAMFNQVREIIHAGVVVVLLLLLLLHLPMFVCCVHPLLGPFFAHFCLSVM